MYDYVIVGGGSAGCVLAARLSEDANVTVCLLEAGPPDTHPLIHIPLGLLWMMRSKVLNWRFHTQPEPHLDGRRLFWPRGRTLGGSGSSNAMLYTRGHPSDYDAWAALGNRGWSFEDVLPHFKRAENHEAGADAFHGVGGPMNVAAQRSPNILTRTFVEAGVQAGLPHNPDFNGREQEGVGLYEVTQRNGRRWSQARGYLEPAMARPNLTVVTGAHATRILFEGDRAVGVAYTRKGRSAQALARREVLLSAGAIQSPQLLMLSGIGDAAQLEAKGIALRKHLPGVGRNLQDHLDVLIVHTCRKAVSAGFTLRNFARAGFEFVRYLVQGKGMLTIVGAEGGGFARSSPDEPIPDLQFHFNPLRLANHGLDLKFLFGDGYSLHVCNLRPRSRGEIRLASADPMIQPEIRANYLSDPEGEDLRRMIEGVKLARRMLAAPAFDPYRGAELRPEPPCDSEEDLRAFVRRHAGTIYHPVGTCRMGSDPMAVVDAQLRVHGVQGLRVVDAAVMPLLVGGNTNAPTVMIAEKASDMIKRGRVLGPGDAAPAKTMDESVPASPKEAVGVVREELGYGLRFLGRHGWRMVLWFVCLLLPLWGFASLVGELHEQEVFAFDAPVLNMLHAVATPMLDRFFVLMSRVGYLWGVVPLDLIVLLLLAARRRFRDGLFFAIAVSGSAVLNIVAKNYFVRLRPELWLSLTPETTYSFPSGHAMGSATLGTALIILCWETRWRWPTTVASLVFVLLVGISRVYLGVHYPSDILAGWSAAVAWVFGMYILVNRKAPPRPSAASSKDTLGAGSATG